MTEEPRGESLSPQDDTGVQRYEWLLVAVWAAVLIIIIAVPIVHGYYVAPEGWTFTGFIGTFLNDYNSYLAWTRQAEEGHLLFRNMYTTEPHGRVFLHPLFWLMGAASGITGAPIIAIWHVTQALGIALMVYAIYRLASLFSDSVATRMLALVLACTSSGLGWWAEVPSSTDWLERPIDLWMAIGNQFHALLTSFFTLYIALALLLLALVHGLEHFRHGRRRDAVFSGLFALALAATHQYDMVTLYVVLGVWMWMTGWQGLRGLVIVVAISVPYCLYSVAVVTLDPVFSHMTWTMPSPPPWAIVVGWGVPLLLALVSLALPGVWRENRDVRLLLAWLVSGLVLIHLPIGFERRLIWGLHVVLCLLAAMGWMSMLRGGLRSLAPTMRNAVISLLSLVLIAFSSIGSVDLYRELFEENREHRFGYYLPDAYLEAFRWLADHTEDADVVIASPRIAPHLPGRAGVTVYWGHWAQTINRGLKADFVRRMFMPEGTNVDEIAGVLSSTNVRFLVLDLRSLNKWGVRRYPNQIAFAFAPLVDRVFQNRAVTIWKVRDSG